MRWTMAGAAALALLVAGCGTNRDDRVGGGAAAGAAAGAGIGALGGPVGALAGAAIGGGAGAVTGATTSPSDVNLGRPPWSNPEVRTPMDERGGSRAARAGGSSEAGNAGVRRAQQQLQARGYNPGGVDGRMGAQTVDAVRAFQRSNDLPETGQLDARTRQALAAPDTGVPAATGTGGTAAPAAGGRTR